MIVDNSEKADKNNLSPLINKNLPQKDNEDQGVYTLIN